MSIARKLLLLAGTAIAALALTAGTATAQETEVEVVQEQGHVPCVDCHIHAEGEATFTDSVGNPLTTCEDEFEGTIQADGSGELEWTPAQHGGPGCNIENCAPPEHHWKIHSLGELETGEEHITVEFCLHSVALQTDIHCTAEVHIADESQHHYILSLTNHPCAGGAFLITGDWEIERPQHAEERLELEHHDD